MSSLHSKKSESLFLLGIRRGSIFIRSYLVLTLVAIIGISTGVFLWRTGQAEKFDHLQNPVPVSSGPGLADIDAWLATGVSSWPPDKLAQAILALDAPAREKVLAKLGDNFRSNPAIWTTFVERLAILWAEQSPGSLEKVTQWLEKLAPNAGAAGPVIIGDFFDELSRNDPTTAVKLINSGFTDRFGTKASADATSSSTMNQLYDLALSRVVKNVMVLDPDYALTCSGYFNDPRLQAQYTKTVQRLMLSGARQSRP